jgi:Zn-dependent peptidase ImmA (M78 family)
MTHTTHTLRELRQLMPEHQLSLAEGRERAEQHAALLLALGGATQPGSDLRPMATLLGVELTVAPDLAVSGMHEFVRGRWLIAIRGRDHITRRRFTLARELWHVVTDSRDDLFVTADAAQLGHWARECADYFAACLLMPKAWVYQAWARGIRDIRFLAAHFVVSRPAMARRLRDLGLTTKPQPDAHGSTTTTRGRS